VLDELESLSKPRRRGCCNKIDLLKRALARRIAGAEQTGTEVAVSARTGEGMRRCSRQLTARCTSDPVMETELRVRSRRARRWRPFEAGW